ncbi:MAG: hypothetical protein HY645_13625 [Acidobacteria bacterium]|nr:hypothetical protein [Acidobacteriota bacterium]
MRSRRFMIFWVLALLLIGGGCARLAKSKKKIEIPPAYTSARTATLEELVGIINREYTGLEALSVSQFEVEFTGGSLERGYLEQYPRGKGYLVVRFPDSIFVNILNPLSNSTVAAMASRGEDFQIWVPGENKFFVGKTTVKLREKNPLYSVRPQHILDALRTEPVPVADGTRRFFLEEIQDEQFKYYIVAVVRLVEGAVSAQLERKLWVERSDLELVRKQYFEDGELMMDIRYLQAAKKDGRNLFTSLAIERPQDGYSLQLDFNEQELQTNPAIKEGAFEIRQPPGAEMVLVK